MAPLPPAPRENIYAELGEKPTFTESGYLKPVKEKPNSIKESEKGEEHYEELVEKINTNDYQKLGVNQLQEGKDNGDKKIKTNEEKTEERSIRKYENETEPDKKLEKKIQKRQSNEIKEDPSGGKIETSKKRYEKFHRNDEDENGYLKLI